METKFYTFIIEQINNAGTVAEYATSAGFNSHKAAQIEYFTKCANIANAIGTSHYYARLEIRDSYGNTFENNVFGERVVPAQEV